MVGEVHTFHNERIGFITDIFLDKPLGDDDFSELYKYMVNKYNLLLIQVRSEQPVIRLLPVRRGNPRIKQIVLFVLTLITIYLTGYGLSQSFYSSMGLPYDQILHPLIMGSIYTILFIAALGLHEYGHMKAARRFGVVIEGPYFIPAPPIQLGFIGTLGAVISMKTLPPTRRSLARIGLSGPINGFIAALLISIVGILVSPIITIEKASAMIESGEAGELGFMPLVFSLLMYLRNIPPGYTILLHPIAFIGFIIFIVTFLNLIPIGQLDGGHVVRSYLSVKTYEILNYAVIIILALTGLFLRGDIGLYYILLSIIMLVFKIIFGRYPHPGPANQYSIEHSPIYMAIYILLLVSTTPIPV